MEAIALLFTKFSDELIGLQVSILCGVAAFSLYWFLLHRRKREKSEWVPAALVKAYLDKVAYDEQDLRYKLFGDRFQGYTAPSNNVAPAPVQQQQTVVSGGVQVVSDPNVLKELEILRGQLSLADQRAMEFDKVSSGLKTEKAALEQKLQDALAAASAAGSTVVATPADGVDTSGMQKELDDLKAKLSEYEVIEDDLANLKRFQAENKTLKEKLETLEKGTGATAAAAPAVAPAAAAQPTPAPTLTVVSGGATPAPEATAAPVAAAAPVEAAPAGSAPTAAPAQEKTAKQKEDELLSEFEKMLAS